MNLIQLLIIKIIPIDIKFYKMDIYFHEMDYYLQPRPILELNLDNYLEPARFKNPDDFNDEKFITPSSPLPILRSVPDTPEDRELNKKYYELTNSSIQLEHILYQELYFQLPNHLLTDKIKINLNKLFSKRDHYINNDILNELREDLKNFSDDEIIKQLDNYNSIKIKIDIIIELFDKNLEIKLKSNPSLYEERLVHYNELEEYVNNLYHKLLI